MHTRPPLSTLSLVLLLAITAAPTVTASSSSLTRVSKHSKPPHLLRRQFLSDIFGDHHGSSTAAAGADSPEAASAGTTGGASSAATGTGTGTGSSSPQAGVSIPLIGASGTSGATSAPTSIGTAGNSAASLTESSSASAASETASSASSSDKSSASRQVIVTITSVLTNDDGSKSTMLSSSASAVAAKSDSGGSGPSGKTWGIIGGVVGGVVLVSGLLLMAWRLTQRRFSDLDDNADFRWPELQPDGQGVSAGLTTLNPQGTRRTGGAGIEMEKDKYEEDVSEWAGGADGSPRVGGGVGGGEGGVGIMRGQNGSEYFGDQQLYEAQSQYRGSVGGAGIGMGSQRGSYYDPYLPSSIPYQSQQSTPIYPPQPITSVPPRVASPYGGYPDVAAASYSSSPHLVHQSLHMGGGANGSGEELPLTAGAVPPAGAGIPYRMAAASPGPDGLRY
ncbi:hypothetical protein JCM11641_006748 [Rhodosporidiobolus odoratus]